MHNVPSLSNEQRAVSVYLLVQAKHYSESLAQFSVWLLTAIGAALALMLANLDNVVKFIPPSSVKAGMYLLLAGLLCGALARYLGTTIKAQIAVINEGHSAGYELGTEIGLAAGKFDWSVFMEELRKSLWPPVRFFTTRTFQQELTGGGLQSVRQLTKSVQILGVVTLLQTIFVLLAALQMVLGIGSGA